MNEVKIDKSDFYISAVLNVGKDSSILGKREILIDKLADSDEIDIQIENSYGESSIISVTRQQLRDLVSEFI
jgi:hypothetical protein